MPAWFFSWVEAERGRFLVLLPVALGSGILVYFALGSEPPPWLGGAVLAVSGAALGLAWRWPYARFAASLALAAALGFARAELRTALLPPLPAIAHHPVDLIGTIARIEFLPHGIRVTLTSPRIDDGPAQPRSVRIKLRPNDSGPLEPGARVSAYAFLFPAEPPAYPGAWNPARDMFFAGRAADGFALEPLFTLAPAPAHGMFAALQALRQRIATNILATLPRDTGSIAITLLTGDEQSIPDPERQQFITAGLAHLLAVAGLHVGIVMGLLFVLIRFLLTRHEFLILRLPVKPLAAAAALVAGAGYACLTGAHLPILRSLAMASLVTFGLIAGRRAFSLRALGLAAAILLLLWPESVVGASFQMSFSAVLALIAGYAAAQGVWSAHRSKNVAARVALHVAALAFTSLLAGGASMPYAAYQFQQIEPYWIPANLIAVPLTAFWIMPWGLVFLLLLPLQLGWLALVPMGWGVKILLLTIAVVAAWPHALLTIHPIAPAAILLYSAGLIWLCLWRSRPRFAGIFLLLLGLALALPYRPPDVLLAPDGRLVAIRGPEAVYLAGRPSAYRLAQWAPLWPARKFLRLPRGTENFRAGPVLFCARPPQDCAGARVAVTLAPDQKSCPGVPAFGPGAARRDLGLAIWLGEKMTVRTGRAALGARPWNRTEKMNEDLH